MRDLGHADPRGRGLVLAWRRWQLWAGVGVVVLGVVVMGGDVEVGAGASDRATAQVARDELGAPVWSIARVDGSRLAASTIGGDVWLKDLATGRALRLNETRGGFALSLAASPDGRILAVAGGRPEVRIWDAERGIEREPMGVGAGEVRSLAFSPDGATLAVGTWTPRARRGAVALWAWPGRRLAAREEHPAGITALGFSPDGSRLIAADSDGELSIRDTATGEVRARRRAHARGVFAMAVSPDGRLIATTGAVDADVRLWDAIDGGPRGALPEAATSATALAFSPDGTMLAIAQGGGRGSIWKVATGREVGAVQDPSGRVQAVAFAGDGRQLATGGIDGSVRLWDLARVLDVGP